MTECSGACGSRTKECDTDLIFSAIGLSANGIDVVSSRLRYFNNRISDYETARGTGCLCAFVREFLIDWVIDLQDRADDSTESLFGLEVLRRLDEGTSPFVLLQRMVDMVQGGVATKIDHWLRLRGGINVREL